MGRWRTLEQVVVVVIRSRRGACQAFVQVAQLSINCRERSVARELARPAAGRTCCGSPDAHAHRPTQHADAASGPGQGTRQRIR